MVMNTQSFTFTSICNYIFAYIQVYVFKLMDVSGYFIEMLNLVYFDNLVFNSKFYMLQLYQTLHGKMIVRR